VRFTLRQLEYFVAAGEAGSITEAARRTHGSQPTVSSAVARLEKSLGVELFVRHHAHGVTLTPAGARFLGEARSLLRQAVELERSGVELAEGVSGPIDLGCLVTLAPVVAPGLCREFVRSHPDAHVELVEGGQEELLRALHDGRISLALTYDLQLGDEIRFEPMATLPPLAVLPADHRLAGADDVALADLATEPLILLDLPLSREYFLSLFLAHGLEPTVARRSPNSEVIRSMVANGFGYTLVNVRPGISRALDGRAFAVLPLRETARPLHIGLASMASARQPRTVEAFREHCAARLPTLVA
jgi:DNA-binding transcriptional LysR family regulator